MNYQSGSTVGWFLTLSVCLCVFLRPPKLSVVTTAFMGGQNSTPELEIFYSGE